MATDYVEKSIKLLFVIRKDNGSRVLTMSVHSLEVQGFIYSMSNLMAICYSIKKLLSYSTCIIAILSLFCIGTALSQDGIIAVTSSVFVLTISSAAFFIFGYFCGRCRKVQEQSLSSPLTRTPIYEDVLPQHHTQELELKANIAYAQSVKK